MQADNAAQISNYGVTCIAEQVLESDPISITERLVTAIVAAANARNVDPPLTVLWQQFADDFKIYKRAQRKIYKIIVSTLKVGESAHYARSVPYGAGMRLLNAIQRDNRQNTTRSLFALFASLFTLQIKSGEIFESLKQRFELIQNRLAGWDPPIVLPSELAYALLPDPRSTSRSLLRINQTHHHGHGRHHAVQRHATTPGRESK